jgi:hypothetical protein
MVELDMIYADIGDSRLLRVCESEDGLQRRIKISEFYLERIA